MKWLRRSTRDAGAVHQADAVGSPREGSMNDTDSWLVAWGCDAAVVYRVPASDDEPGHIMANGIQIPDLSASRPRAPRRPASDERPGDRRPEQ